MSKPNFPHEFHPYVIGIGEVLWDLFPDNRRVGGAPLNFAYFCGRLGARSAVISRVGKDEEGRALIEAIAQLGVETSLIQVDQEKPTGMVRVTVGPNGIPEFECPEDTAWDYIEATAEAMEAAKTADILGFGTLAQRKDPSWKTIHRLLAQAKPECLRVCDVNLRQQYYSPEFLTESFIQSDIVKLNEVELGIVKNVLKIGPSDDQAARHLVKTFDLTALVLTLGPHGAKAWSENDYAEQAGLVVRVRDTVGSGDAFVATFAMEIARGSSLANALYWANTAGAYLATQVGATPEFSWELLRSFSRR
jgi:fructokinase